MFYVCHASDLEGIVLVGLSSLWLDTGRMQGKIVARPILVGQKRPEDQSQEV